MYAVIDLGSNSFHLLIVELKRQQISVVGRCSEKVQLAEGLDSTGCIGSDAMERGLQCLHRFKTILQDHPIEKIKAVGTEALRRASNSEFFLSQAKKIGFSIDIISGQEEAQWIYKGICGPLADSEHARLTIDIGGASTEIAVGSNDSILFSDSVAVGCVRWRDQFFSPRLEFKQNHIAAAKQAKLLLTPTLQQLQQFNWAEVYASSGSAKMLSAINYANGWNDGMITLDCIEKVENILCGVSTIEEIKLPGLKPQRLDLLAPGLVILATIMRELGIETIAYSPTALREGILSDLVNRRVDYQLQRELH